MKLAIFGSTGRTGQHLLRMALEEDHQVVALARDPAKLLVQNENLTVIRGSLKDADCIHRVVAGVDAVLSVLGPTSNQPTFEISQGMQMILNAMKGNGVKRLVISAGAGVGDPQDAPKPFNQVMNMLLKAAAKNVYEDMLQMVSLVRESDLDWTVVRVPMLTDDTATGQIKMGMVGKGMGPRISRADLAAFMLQQAKSREFIRQAPAISS
jgi:putative NADH-flavin reductase